MRDPFDTEKNIVSMQEAIRAHDAAQQARQAALAATVEAGRQAERAARAEFGEFISGHLKRQRAKRPPKAGK